MEKKEKTGLEVLFDSQTLGIRMVTLYYGVRDGEDCCRQELFVSAPCLSPSYGNCPFAPMFLWLPQEPAEQKPHCGHC